MTALPPTYYLHVWWARRPLVASRAAISASLLPATADRDRFLHLLGIHGDPIAAKKRIAKATREGVRLGADAYGYPRAFGYLPTGDERRWFAEQMASLGVTAAYVLDPTAGGGSVPFESARLGLGTIGNDLNPVAAFIQKATIDFPINLGDVVRPEVLRLGRLLSERVRQKLAFAFPDEPEPDTRPDGYLWARTIRCPHCEGMVPLSPNWRLAPSGAGVRLKPSKGSGPGDRARCVQFEVVAKAKDQSAATVTGGDASCPFDDCGRLISGDYVKQEAQAGRMGQQLYAVVFKRRVPTTTKAGKRGKDKWNRGYRAPRAEDDVSEKVNQVLAKKLPEWEALDMVPTEAIGDISNYDRGHRMYGMNRWVDLFAPRQLLAHGTGVEVYRSLLEAERAKGELPEPTRAAFCYLALALDKFADYNSKISAWHGGREVLEHTFRDHAYVLKWSFAEMAPLVEGLGYDWAIKQTVKSLGELVALVRPQGPGSLIGQSGFDFGESSSELVPPPVILSCKSGDSLDHVADASIDAVVMDPPYYNNVMYAELSDFFYVWLKRTAGYVYPEFFRRQLTDKENEAVANPAKFKGEKGANALAGRDYQRRMAAIFAEMRRVLKAEGIMTLMFTHKATGAWDALTTGLIEAGFAITASWPINTEAEASMHIKDKSAANSTIFLVCRPRTDHGNEVRYWEDTEPTVRQAVRQRIAQFQQGGIRGVDLYLSCFGPALEAFSQAWPLKRGSPRQDVEQTRRRKRQSEMFEEEYDPYAVTPEDALEVARREVKEWRLHQLTHVQRNVELDNLTSWFVLAWDAFEAPVFPYDEANRLAKVCGVDLERDVVGKLAEKKASDLVMWDSVTRAAKGSLGLPDGCDSMMDAIHHLARAARSASLESANELLAKHSLANEPGFLVALEAVLEVLPVGKEWSGLDLPDAAAGAGADFDAMEKLRRLALADKVAEPEQLKIWQDETTA
jgi:putative DNA methylase